MEHRNGLIVGTYLTQADGYAERDAALLMAHQKRRKSKKPMTLAADKAYDTHDFVGALRELKITPHVAQNDRNRRSAIDGRTTRHQSYQIMSGQALLGRETVRLDEVGGAATQGQVAGARAF